MKKIKLLTSLGAIATLSGAVAVTATGCNENKETVATITDLVWTRNPNPTAGKTSILSDGVIKVNDKELDKSLIKSISDDGSDKALNIQLQYNNDSMPTICITPTEGGSKTLKLKVEV